ncbi:MAG: helix-turn-helix domain-containing protein [Phycisphaerales bacterium]
MIDAREPAMGLGAAARRIHELTGYKPGRSTLWRWHLSGRLPARRLGGRLYFTESAIRAMLEADALCNRGTADARARAAAARLANAINRDARGEVA